MGRGLGRGLGLGLGLGCRWGARWFAAQAAVGPADELQALQQQAELLERQLGAVKQRIESLGKTEG